MTKLSEISIEQAQSFTKMVGYEDRMTGTTMSGSGGNKHVSIYSIKEMLKFLFVDSFDRLSQRGHGSTISYLNLDELIRWIAEVYEDKELADAISEGMSNADNYAAKIEIAGNLLKERMQQCEEILK
jgi:hypothetical protein